MKILHISDIHYRQSYEPCEKGYKAVLYRMQSPLEPLGRCLAQARESYPDLDCLLISGDLTEDGTAEDYAQLRQFIEDQVGGLPVVVTLGNHDNKASFYQGWLGQEPSSEPYNCVAHFGDTAIISWDTSVQGNPDGVITPQQMQWLKDAFAQIQDRHIILMTHHHFMEHQASVPAIPDQKEFPELLRDRQIDCLLCGHTHHKFAYFYGDVPYYTVDGMSFYADLLMNGAVRFRETYGYNYYKIDDGMVSEHRTATFNTGKVLDTMFW